MVGAVQGKGYCGADCACFASGTESMKISFTLNGNIVEVEAPPRVTLLQLLREYLGLTGPKPGCEVGEKGGQEPFLIQWLGPSRSMGEKVPDPFSHPAGLVHQEAEGEKVPDLFSLHAFV